MSPEDCSHPITTEPPPTDDCRGERLRSCLTCGLSYDRQARLLRLEQAIRARHRLRPIRLEYDDLLEAWE